jgi:hypothetical protein
MVFGSVFILAIAVIIVWKIVIWFGEKQLKKSVKNESAPSSDGQTKPSPSAQERESTTALQNKANIHALCDNARTCWPPTSKSRAAKASASANKR